MLLNTLEVSTSKVFLDSYVNKDKFVSVNNMLREQKEMKEKVKNPENAADYISKKKKKRIMSAVRKILQTNILVSKKLNKTD